MGVAGKRRGELQLKINEKEIGDDLHTTQMRASEGLGDGEVEMVEIDAGGRNWKATAAALERRGRSPCETN
jgi:hypothetical protein